MQQFLSNGGLSKMLWIILTFIVGLSSVVVAGIEIVNGKSIDPYIASILAGIIAHVFTVGGSVNAVSQMHSQADIVNQAVNPLQTNANPNPVNMGTPTNAA